MTSLEFIEQKFTYHGPMMYNSETFKWELERLSTKKHGIYAILLDKDIMKFGKADSDAGGLRRRLDDYRNHSPKRRGFDPTSNLWHTVMTGPLADKVLELYYWETPIRTISDELLDIDITMSSARQYEKKLSKMAKAEGHSLLLTGQN